MRISPENINDDAIDFDDFALIKFGCGVMRACGGRKHCK
jgi:hypothetical protein